MRKSAGAAGASREYRPFENTHGLINAGLFPSSDEKEMILKASNILKQKLFAEDFFLSQANVKSLKNGYGAVKVAREEAFKGPYGFSFGKTFKVLKLSPGNKEMGLIDF